MQTEYNTTECRRRLRALLISAGVDISQHITQMLLSRVRRLALASTAAASAIYGVSQRTVNAAPSTLDESSAILHPRLTVLSSRAMTALLTTMRSRDTPPEAFASAADRLMNMLAEEALARLSSITRKTVVTPTGDSFDGLALPPDSDLVVVSIMRAGDSLLEAVRRTAPGAAVGKILIQRDEASTAKVPILFYVKLPPDIAQRRHVILVDPMCATGGSAAIAIDELIRRGVKEDAILFMNVIAAPEGLAYLRTTHPRVTIVTAALDARLNGDKYICPGLGDYGDRYFGTVQQ